MNREMFRNYAYLYLMVLLALVGLVMLNIIAGIYDSRNPVRVDLTESDLYTLPQEAADLMGAMQHNITIYVLGNPDQWQENTYYVRIARVLHTYATASKGRVSVEYLDPAVHTDLSSRFSGIPDLCPDDILVEGPYRTVRLVPTRFYEHQYNDDQTALIPYRLTADTPLLNALETVLRPTLGRVYFLYSQREGNSQITKLRAELEEADYECLPLDLHTDTIPEDADFLVSMGAQEDFSLGDIDQINRFMDGGGFFLVLFRHSEEDDKSLFTQFLAERGVGVEKAVMLDAENNNGSPTDVKLKLCEVEGVAYPFFSALDKQQPGYMVSGYSLVSLWPAGGEGERRAVTLLQTYENSSYAKLFAETPDLSVTGKSPVDRQGPFAAAVLTEERTAAGTARLLVTSYTLADDNVGMAEPYAAFNRGFFLSLLRHYTPEQAWPGVQPKALTPQSPHTGGGSVGLLIALSCVAPLLVCALGLWRFRKNI